MHAVSSALPPPGSPATLTISRPAVSVGVGALKTWRAAPPSCDTARTPAPASTYRMVPSSSHAREDKTTWAESAMTTGAPPPRGTFFTLPSRATNAIHAPSGENLGAPRYEATSSVPASGVTSRRSRSLAKSCHPDALLSTSTTVPPSGEIATPRPTIASLICGVSQSTVR